MKLRRKVTAVNHSLVLVLPADVCRVLGMKKGGLCDVDIQDGKIVVEPVAEAKAA